MNQALLRAADRLALALKQAEQALRNLIQVQAPGRAIQLLASRSGEPWIYLTG